MSSWDPDQERLLEELDREIAAGNVRAHIDCDEARTEWFAMARRMYVGNDPELRVPIDFEVGAHIASCPMPACQLLATAYWSILRPSQPEESERLTEAINHLEAKVNATNN